MQLGGPLENMIMQSNMQNNMQMQNGIQSSVQMQNNLHSNLQMQNIVVSNMGNNTMGNTISNLQSGGGTISSGDGSTPLLVDGNSQMTPFNSIGTGTQIMMVMPTGDAANAARAASGSEQNDARDDGKEGVQQGTVARANSTDSMQSLQQQQQMMMPQQQMLGQQQMSQQLQQQMQQQLQQQMQQMQLGVLPPGVCMITGDDRTSIPQGIVEKTMGTFQSSASSQTGIAVAGSNKVESSEVGFSAANCDHANNSRSNSTGAAGGGSKSGETTAGGTNQNSSQPTSQTSAFNLSLALMSAASQNSSRKASACPTPAPPGTPKLLGRRDSGDSADSLKLGLRELQEDKAGNAQLGTQFNTDNVMNPSSVGSHRNSGSSHPNRSGSVLPQCPENSSFPGSSNNSRTNSWNNSRSGSILSGERNVSVGSRSRSCRNASTNANINGKSPANFSRSQEPGSGSRAVEPALATSEDSHVHPPGDDYQNESSQRDCAHTEAHSDGMQSDQAFSDQAFSDQAACGSEVNSLGEGDDADDDSESALNSTRGGLNPEAIGADGDEWTENHLHGSREMIRRSGLEHGRTQSYGGGYGGARNHGDGKSGDTITESQLRRQGCLGEEDGEGHLSVQSSPCLVQRSISAGRWGGIAESPTAAATSATARPYVSSADNASAKRREHSATLQSSREESRGGNDPGTEASVDERSPVVPGEGDLAHGLTPAAGEDDRSSTARSAADQSGAGKQVLRKSNSEIAIVVSHTVAAELELPRTNSDHH